MVNFLWLTRFRREIRRSTSGTRSRKYSVRAWGSGADSRLRTWVCVSDYTANVEAFVRHSSFRCVSIRDRNYIVGEECSYGYVFRASRMSASTIDSGCSSKIELLCLRRFFPGCNI